ncbi:hypothetical protein JCM33374_g4492 [Metschnikowia sp. JCM 33374]|nr:hypothetical protein JCM33374_g4492 [Metschnikowia sp. JCM 33374]
MKPFSIIVPMTLLFSASGIAINKDLRPGIGPDINVGESSQSVLVPSISEYNPESRPNLPKFRDSRSSIRSTDIPSTSSPVDTFMKKTVSSFDPYAKSQVSSGLPRKFPRKFPGILPGILPGTLPNNSTNSIRLFSRDDNFQEIKTRVHNLGIVLAYLATERRGEGCNWMLLRTAIEEIARLNCIQFPHNDPDINRLRPKIEKLQREVRVLFRNNIT